MSIIDEIKSYFGCGSSGKALAHYGTPRHSGRYPWGSGENPFQHSGDFLSRIDELKKSGMTETEIAHELGLSTTQYRVQKQLASHERRQLEVDRAKSLRADGKSLNEIAKIMGYQYDSSVRSLLNDNFKERIKEKKYDRCWCRCRARDWYIGKYYERSSLYFGT